jgi:AcrR family transcriptional regulator
MTGVHSQAQFDETAEGATDRPHEPGLREQKKLKARADIASAALRLFTKYGFDAVSVEDIATEAGVSRRSFFRYFTSKEDALLADFPLLTDVLRSALSELGDADLLDAVLSVMHRMADTYEERRLAVLSRSEAWTRTPSVVAGSAKMAAEWRHALCEVIARQRGTDPYDLVPRVVSHLAVGTFQAAVERWVHLGGTGDLKSEVDKAFGLAADTLKSLLVRP